MRSQRGQDRRVVGLRTVREVLERRVDGEHLRLEVTSRLGAWGRALGALHDARRKAVSDRVRQVAIDQVERDVVRSNTLLEHFLENLLGLFESNQDDRVGAGGFDLSNLGREIGRLRVIRDDLAAGDLATVGREVVRERLAQTVTVNVGQCEDGYVLAAILARHSTKHGALEYVRRSRTEVEAIVIDAGQVDRGIRGGNLNRTGTGDLLVDGASH